MASKKIYPYICSICGKDFLINSSTRNRLLSGKYKNTYCSKECSIIAKQRGSNITCINCGKVFYRKKSHIQRQENQFCSNECSNEYSHKMKSEIRKCEICGKEFEVGKMSTQRFCSIQCQGKWQSTQINELNPRFKRQKIQCDTCGKEFFEKQYKLRDFDNHFCSTDCRRKWFAEICSQREDFKEQARIRGAYLMSIRDKKDKSDKINSKPQLAVNSLLDEMSIEYEREKNLVYYSVDNYLKKYNLIIEIQGDYWHCSPIKYVDKISEMQAEVIRSDKAKHTYIKRTYDIDVLYLWENDITKNIELCRNLIKLYVENNGELPNYNSFNYQLIDGEIALVDNLITPYQEQPFELYKEKIHKKYAC